MKRKLLHWAAQFPLCVMLDSCGTEVDRYGEYDFLLGVGFGKGKKQIQTLEELEADINAFPLDWRFGVMTYDLKNEVEPKLSTRTEAAVPFPGLQMFVPDVVVAKPRGKDVLHFEKGFSRAMYHVIAQQPIRPPAVTGFSGFTSNFSRPDYLRTIDRLRAHIRDGDCYEINLTQNFTADAQIAAPAALYEELAALSPVPFAGYARFGHIHLLCASPERFLQLKSGRLLTQPIKGTAPRGTTPEADATLAANLRASHKEQAENVMIVDLSRNDLYKSAEVDSVEVPDLFEVQTFPQVHHLVSTITAQRLERRARDDVIVGTADDRETIT
ncbi:MAG: chorismate-binding protein, partial [Bacteroidota bacterium]